VRIGKNTLLVIVALCVPNLVALFLRGLFIDQPPSPSYYARCGGNAIAWLLACSIGAAVACCVRGAALYRTVRQRPKGHPMNGLTMSYVIEAFICGWVFISPALNLLFVAPCWLTPFLYTAITGSCVWVAAHTVQRTPMLAQVPMFEIQKIEEIQARLRENNVDEAQRLLQDYHELKANMEVGK